MQRLIVSFISFKSHKKLKSIPKILMTWSVKSEHSLSENKINALKLIIRGPSTSLSVAKNRKVSIKENLKGRKNKYSKNLQKQEEILEKLID